MASTATVSDETLVVDGGCGYTDIDDAFLDVEAAGTAVTMAAARKWAAVDDALAEAGRRPEVFVGPSASNDSEAVEFARRAAVCELALRLGVSEAALRSLASAAHSLRNDLPTVWAGFRDGIISEQKARIVLEAASGLDDTVVAAFDEAVTEPAIRLTPPKLRTAALALREKLNPRPASVRHEVAAADRRVWLEPAADGMCWLGAYLTADAGMRATARVDAAARALTAQPGETRTLPQARADVLADLLTGDGTGHAVTATVTVTVPVTTVLDRNTPESYRTNPAVLNGYGPIDPDTARRLCANAPSLYRLLTDPIDGAILTVDRKRYRPPADLKRLVRALYPVCTFPGCNRRVTESDIDHTLDRQYGGCTELGNLSPLCRHHHRVKHRTLWRMSRNRTDRPAGRITWRSPTGTVHDSDPPPF